MADNVVPPTDPSEDPSKEASSEQSSGPAKPAQPTKVSDSLVKRLKRIITSTLLLIIAFMLVHAFLDLLMAGIARNLGYKITSLTYNHLRLHPTDWRHWSRGRVALVYFFPPLFCLVIGLMLLNFLRVNTQWLKSSRMLVFWLMICFANICLAHLFFSPLGISDASNIGDEAMGFYQTFAIMGSWMYFNGTVMGVFAVFAVVFSLVYGVISRDEVLRYSPSGRATQKPRGKHLFVFQLYLLPVLLSFFPLIWLCDKSNVFPTMFIYINLIIIGIGMFIRNANDNKSMRSDKNDVLNHVPLVEFVIAAALLIGVYFFYR